MYIFPLFNVNRCCTGDATRFGVDMFFSLVIPEVIHRSSLQGKFFLIIVLSENIWTLRSTQSLFDILYFIMDSLSVFSRWNLFKLFY